MWEKHIWARHLGTELATEARSSAPRLCIVPEFVINHPHPENRADQMLSWLCWQRSVFRELGGFYKQRKSTVGWFPPSVSFYRMTELKHKGRVLSAKLNSLITCRGKQVFKRTQLPGCKTNHGGFTHHFWQSVWAFKNCFMSTGLEKKNVYVRVFKQIYKNLLGWLRHGPANLLTSFLTARLVLPCNRS